MPVADIVCGIGISLLNVLLLYVIAKNSKFRSISYQVIGSLGLSDLVVGLSSVVSGCVRLPYWDIPDAIYTAQLMFVISMVGLSCLHMSIIAFLRWLYVVHPYFYLRHVNTIRQRRMIAIIWMITCPYTLMLFLLESEVYGSLPMQLLALNTLVMLCGVIIPYVILMLTTCLFYLLILKEARLKQSNALHSQDRNRPEKTVLKKNLAFFLTVFGLFFIMTAVPVICLFIELFIELPPATALIIVQPLYLSSGCNFMVLLLRDERFKIAFLKMYFWWCKKEDLGNGELSAPHRKTESKTLGIRGSEVIVTVKDGGSSEFNVDVAQVSRLQSPTTLVET